MKNALSYRRELYRLWFEYLKVAYASRDPEVQKALKASAGFYLPWDNVPNAKFDLWWKTHGYLFEERHTVRSLSHGEMPSDPNALVIQVPLNQSPTELTKHVRAIIQEKSAERKRLNRKSKRRPSSIYRPTEGVEPKLLALREMLTVYRDVYLKNPKLRGEKLLDAVHAFYEGRKNRRWAKVPIPLIKGGGYVGIVRPLRNLRRYIQKAEAVTNNVAAGEFPGRY
jgi:hypothetical protein